MKGAAGMGYVVCSPSTRCAPRMGVQTASVLHPARRTDAAWRMAWLEGRGRAWQAAISPGEAHAALDPGIPEWDLPTELEQGSVAPGFTPGSANSPNGNIQVGEGGEIKRDSLSTGEGKGKSPNRIPRGDAWEM